MNRNWRRIYGFLLVLSAFSLSPGGAHAQEATKLQKSVAQKSADRGTEAVLTGTYSGFVKVGEVTRRATLEIKETIGEYGNNFTLEIEGVPQIEGRIVARVYPDSKAVFANLRFENNAAQAMAFNEYSQRLSPPSLSLRLIRKGDSFKLESIEHDKPFLFENCVPSRCQEQVECQPC